MIAPASVGGRGRRGTCACLGRRRDEIGESEEQNDRTQPLGVVASNGSDRFPGDGGGTRSEIGGAERSRGPFVVGGGRRRTGNMCVLGTEAGRDRRSEEQNDHAGVGPGRRRTGNMCVLGTEAGQDRRSEEQNDRAGVGRGRGRRRTGNMCVLGTEHSDTPPARRARDNAGHPRTSGARDARPPRGRGQPPRRPECVISSTREARAATGRRGRGSHGERSARSFCSSDLRSRPASVPREALPRRVPRAASTDHAGHPRTSGAAATCSFAPWSLDRPS
jgi:hypothetical protein